MVKKNIGNEPEITEEIPETTPVEEKTEVEEVPTKSEREVQLEAQLVEKEESYKGLQRTLNIKDEKLKEQATDTVWKKAMEERFEIMATLLDKRLVSGEMGEDEKASLKQEFTELGKRQTKEIADARIQAESDAYGEKARALYARAQQVFSEDLDSRDKVLYNLDKGRLDEADARISMAEKAKEIKMPNEPKGSTETEDEVFERIARKRGLLKGESLTPSGKTKTPEQVLQDFNEGKASFEDYAKVRDQLTFKE